MKLVTPVINLNGNTAEDLIEKLKGVLNALRETEKAMVNAHDIVHGRNFQTLPGGGQDERWQAQYAWQARVKIIADVYDEVMELASEIQKQKR